MRYLAQFRKTGPASYISHLDLMRAMQRALRRADVPMCYSQGFNPHPVLSFAMASPVGMVSHAEYMDVRVEDDADATAITSALIGTLPQGLAIVRSRMAPQTYPTLMSCVSLCDAAVTFLQQSDLQAKWQRFINQDAILVQKHSKKGMRTVDIRPWIVTSQMQDNVLSVRLCAGSAANLSPMLLAQTFCLYAGMEPEYRCLQRALWAGSAQAPLDLFELDVEAAQ